MTHKARSEAAKKAWRTRRANKLKHKLAGEKAAVKRKHRRAGLKGADVRLAKEASQL